MNKYLLLIVLFFCSCKSEHIEKTVHAYPLVSDYEDREKEYWVNYEVNICNHRNMSLKYLIGGEVHCKQSQLDSTLKILNHIVDSVALVGEALIKKNNK